MNLAVTRERRAGEARVAATPESVRKLKGLGLNVIIETGAGEGARIADSDYADAGAEIAADATSAVRIPPRRKPRSLRTSAIRSQ